MMNRLRDVAIRGCWSIGIYVGEDPLALTPAPGARNPVLTRHDVTDVPASFVADPFMIRVDGVWHMFFEVYCFKAGSRRGVIGHATSADGLRWEYRRVVLSEPFHLSYPHVFASGSDVYMVPESTAAGAVRLYRADPFPDRWTFVAELVKGSVLLDSSLFEHEGRWWMFTESRRRFDTLRLFHAPALEGPWREHPRSPIVNRDPRASRPAGRVLVAPGRLVRFAQDCVPDYGTAVRAFEITALSTDEYAERPVGNGPVLEPGHADWSRDGMHQLDVHRLDDRRWIACVDGRKERPILPSELVHLVVDRCLRGARRLAHATGPGPLA